MRDIMRNLMAEHGGQPVFCLADPEDAREDEDFVAREDKGVELVRVVDDVDFPGAVALGDETGVGNEAVEDALHEAMFGSVRREDDRSEFLEHLFVAGGADGDLVPGG
jgi:hypothetical protein